MLWYILVIIKIALYPLLGMIRAPVKPMQCILSTVCRTKNSPFEATVCVTGDSHVGLIYGVTSSSFATSASDQNRPAEPRPWSRRKSLGQILLRPWENFVYPWATSVSNNKARQGLRGASHLLEPYHSPGDKALHFCHPGFRNIMGDDSALPRPKEHEFEARLATRCHKLYPSMAE